MKTLKQIFIKTLYLSKLGTVKQPNTNSEELFKKFKEINKEWLQQKQKEHKQTIMISIDDLFKELLEELK